MNSLTLDGWCKGRGDSKSRPMGTFSFHLDEVQHLRLEEAEEHLQDSEQTQVMLPVDMRDIELVTPDECGPLSDCQLRVYRGGEQSRGQFHLVGHRVSDGSLVYTNAVMVDLLG